MTHIDREQSEVDTNTENENDRVGDEEVEGSEQDCQLFC